jgi:RHS repeat-associated protein
VEVGWPFGLTAYNQKVFQLVAWHGSLLEQQRDGSGLLFKRNRYVDPTTGAFTQEDPIGLAGGMNLYGFAGGDPVTYSDPFGLCPIPPQACVAAAAAAGLARAAATPTRQRIIERGSQLARNLAQTGALRSAGQAAHHIVAKAAERAAPAREVLLRVGIQIDEAVNGVVLPAMRDYAGQAANHLTLHTNRYYEAVNQALANVLNREQAVQVLDAIRKSLQGGTFPR